MHGYCGQTCEGSVVPLSVGKLPQAILDRLLKLNRSVDPRVIIGPRVGEDAAVLDTGGENYLVSTTDPITFATERIGWYCVNINANDIVVMGAKPTWFMATLLLPESHSEEEVETIFKDILNACGQLAVSLIGGHTEVTHGLDRPILVGQMFGEVAKQRLVTSAGARVGDAVLLTKGIAIEGTAIIANEMSEEIKNVLTADNRHKARKFLTDPGISVVRDASIALDAGELHAMHDPTEGGVATALHEMAKAAGVGFVIEEDAIPVYAETKLLCRHFGLDPLGLIASGALLIVCPKSEAEGVAAALQKQTIEANIIGRVVDQAEGIKLLGNTGLRDLAIFEQDEITRILTS